jgi:hypothetical protein
MSPNLTVAARAVLTRQFEKTWREYEQVVYGLARRHRYPLPTATRLHQMVGAYGYAETAKRLMQAPKAQTGFTDLWLFGQTIGIDLISKYSIEALMLEARFHSLFDDGDYLAEARRRLDEVNRPAVA